MQERIKETVLVDQVRRRLEAAEGVPLPEGRAPVGRRADGTQRQHVFDLVAENRSLIGEVRTYTFGESGGRPAGKFAHCYAACFFLFRSKARRKVLVLTDRAFWSRFRRESEGLVEGIEIIHVPVDDTFPIVIDEPTEAAPPSPTVRRNTAPGRAPSEPASGFSRQDELPTARRNKGGPGPRGRRPITGPRRGR